MLSIQEFVNENKRQLCENVRLFFSQYVCLWEKFSHLQHSKAIHCQNCQKIQNRNVVFFVHIREKKLRRY